MNKAGSNFDRDPIDRIETLLARVEQRQRIFRNASDDMVVMAADMRYLFNVFHQTKAEHEQMRQALLMITDEIELLIPDSGMRERIMDVITRGLLTPMLDFPVYEPLVGDIVYTRVSIPIVDGTRTIHVGNIGVVEEIKADGQVMVHFKGAKEHLLRKVGTLACIQRGSEIS